MYASESFSILADETTDISGIKQLAFCARNKTLWQGYFKGDF